MSLDGNRHHARSTAVFIGVTVAFIFATVFVFARIISRFYILKHRKWDDFSIILAWILAFGMAFTIDFSTFKGLGRQDSAIPAAWVTPLLASEYAAFILYSPALMATKTSILILYLRISKNTRLFLYWASYITLIVVNIAGVVLTFITITQCRPVRAAYTPDIKEAQCISIETIYLVSAPVNIATDLAILILPIPVLTAMNLPWRQKSILVLTFLLGAFITVIDVVRIYYLQLGAANVNTPSTANATTSLLFSYNVSWALLWSAIQVNIGIICACIPVMRPLITHVFLGRMFHHTHHNSVTRAPLPGLLLSTVLHSHNSEEYRQQAVVDMELVSAIPQVGNEGQQIRMMRQTQTLDENPRMMAAELRPNSSQFTEHLVGSTFNRATGPKCMLNMRDSESVKYCIMVTIIYSVWGFAFALLIILNGQIAIAGHPTPVQSLGIICASFGGRIVGPLLLGIWILWGVGFKATFVTGLGIHCIGTLMFWPSGYLRSYPGFIVSNFVVGFGFALVITATYGFLTLCGPPHHAEFRVCLSNGIQAFATVLGELLTQKLANVVQTGSLIAVQWTYLAIAISTVFLALGFYYIPLPEATDSDLQIQAEQQRRTLLVTSFGGFPVIFITLAMAVLCMILTNGAWAWLASSFDSLISSVARTTSSHPALSSANYYMVANSIYAVSSCIFAALCLFVPSHVLMLLAYTGSIIFTALTMGLDLPSVNSTLAIRLVIPFFLSPIFPLLFAIGVRGLGRWTKPAVCLLTSASGVGACIFLFVGLAVQQAHTVRYSLCVVVALFALATLFPLYLILFPAARNQFKLALIPPTTL